MSKRIRQIKQRSIAALLTAVLMFTAVPISAGAVETSDAAEIEDAAGAALEEMPDVNITEDGFNEDEIGASENDGETVETEVTTDNVTTDESAEENINEATEEVTDDRKNLAKENIYEAEMEGETIGPAEDSLYSVIGDDYPYATYCAGCHHPMYGDNHDDTSEGFFYRQCTSFASWRLRSKNGVDFNNNYLGVTWGNAGNWGNAARSVGITVDNTPSIGSIWWSDSGAYGHVAWVAEVNGSQVTIEEYNWEVPSGYGTRPLPASSATGYIHIKDIQSPSLDRVKGTYMDTGYAPVIPDGYYHIASSLGDDWWLTIAAMSNDNSANVNIWNYGSMGFDCDEQLFYFQFIDEGDGRGFYKITAKHSGKCLDVADGSEYLYDVNGNLTNLQQYEDNGTSAQQWAVSATDGGDKGMLYTFQARCSGYCIDLLYATTENGANICMHTGNGTPAQQWRLVPWAPAIGRTIEDGEYQIAYHAAEDKTIGAVGTDSGANIELNSAYKEDSRQTFDVKYLENGYYSITNKYTGLSLDVAEAGRMQGANVQLHDSNGSDAQKWSIQSCGDGYFNIISKCSGAYLNLDDGNTDDGTNIDMLYWNVGSANQKWELIPYVQSKLPTPTATLSNAETVEAGTQFYLNKNGADDVYYTWNGIAPTKQDTHYSDNDGLTIPSGQEQCTLKALGVKEGYQDSDILEITYTVKQNSSSGEGDSSDEEDPQDGVKWHYNEQNVAYRDLSEYGKIATSIKPITYNGTPYKPAIKVTTVENGRTITLTEGTDYRVLYNNNIHAGTARVTVKGNGIYKGTISKNFEIKKKSCKKLKVVAAGMLKGDSSAPKIYVYDGNTLLKENKDYTLYGITSDLTSAKGTKQIYVMAAPDSDYEDIKPFKITVYDTKNGRIKGIIDNPENIQLSQNTYTYTGKACKPTAIVTVDGNILKAGKDYTIKYQNNKNAGCASATIKGKGSYAGSIVKEFTIEPSDGEFTLKKPIAAVTYNGRLQKPKIIVQANGKKLKQNRDYTLSYTNNLHVSNCAKVTVRGKSNYADMTATVFYFKINPCPIKKATIKGRQGNLMITHAKHTLVEGVDYDVIYGTGAGKRKISITIKAKEGSNFTGEVTKKIKQ